MRKIQVTSDFLVRGRRPSIPPNMRLYAIGDIHGRVDLLRMLLNRIYADLHRRPAVASICIFLGDYIDRGPSSRDTIDALIEHSSKHKSVFLRGNHESMAIKSLRDASQFNQWLRLGGVETLISYGISANTLRRSRDFVELQTAFQKALPQSHIRFFLGLSNSFNCGDFFFAHAGIKPNFRLCDQRETDLIWIREEFLLSKADFGKIVVHGHTPTNAVECASNRINIDTGAYASGLLSCLVIDQLMLSIIDTGPPHNIGSA